MVNSSVLDRRAQWDVDDLYRETQRVYSGNSSGLIEAIENKRDVASRFSDYAQHGIDRIATIVDSIISGEASVAADVYAALQAEQSGKPEEAASFKKSARTMQVSVLGLQSMELPPPIPVAIGTGEKFDQPPYHLFYL